LQTPLHVACRNGHLAVVEALVATAGHQDIVNVQVCQTSFASTFAAHDLGVSTFVDLNGIVFFS
jgi:ankyrin repeat protein